MSPGAYPYLNAIRALSLLSVTALTAALLLYTAGLLQRSKRVSRRQASDTSHRHLLTVSTRLCMLTLICPLVLPGLCGWDQERSGLHRASGLMLRVHCALGLSVVTLWPLLPRSAYSIYCLARVGGEGRDAMACKAFDYDGEGLTTST